METTIKVEIIFFLDKYTIASHKAIYANCCNTLGYLIDKKIFMEELDKVAKFDSKLGLYTNKNGKFP